MRSVLVRVGILVEEQLLVVHPLVPVGAHDDPFAGPDVAVFPLPRLDAVGGQQEIRVFGGLGGAVDDVDRRGEALDVERVGIAVLEILAREPVVRRVEMGAGMLAQLEPVPGEERPVGIVFADLVDLDLGGVAGEVLGQAQDRRLRPERRGAVHDPHLARQERGSELAQQVSVHPGSFLLQVDPLSGVARLSPVHDLRGDVEDGVDGVLLGHDAGREAQDRAAEIDRVALDPQRADDRRGLGLVGHLEHRRAAAPLGVTRREERQVQPVGMGDDPIHHLPVAGRDGLLVLPGEPADRGQRGDGGDRAGRAGVEAARIGGVFELVEIPREGVVLAEPAAALGGQVLDDLLVGVEDARARRAAEPLERGGDDEVDARFTHVEGDQPRRLGDVGHHQAAHLAPVGHQRGIVHLGRGGRGHPGQQRQRHVAVPGVDEILSFDPGLARAARHGLQREADFGREARQQEMQRGKAVLAHQHGAAFQTRLGQGAHQLVQRVGDVVDMGDRALGRVDEPPPGLDEILPLAQDIAPLLVVRRGPDGRELGHRLGHVPFLAGVEADGMVEEIAAVVGVALHLGSFPAAVVSPSLRAIRRIGAGMARAEWQVCGSSVPVGTAHGRCRGSDRRKRKHPAGRRGVTFRSCGPISSGCRRSGLRRRSPSPPACRRPPSRPRPASRSRPASSAGR